MRSRSPELNKPNLSNSSFPQWARYLAVALVAGTVGSLLRAPETSGESSDPDELDTIERMRGPEEDQDLRKVMLKGRPRVLASDSPSQAHTTPLARSSFSPMSLNINPDPPAGTGTLLPLEEPITSASQNGRIAYTSLQIVEYQQLANIRGKDALANLGRITHLYPELEAQVLGQDNADVIRAWRHVEKRYQKMIQENGHDSRWVEDQLDSVERVLEKGGHSGRNPEAPATQEEIELVSSISAEIDRGRRESTQVIASLRILEKYFSDQERGKVTSRNAEILLADILRR